MSAAEQSRRDYQRSTMSIGERVEALERQVEDLREDLGPVGVTRKTSKTITTEIATSELDYLFAIEDAARSLVMMPTPTGDAQRAIRWETLVHFIRRTKP